MPKAKPTPKAQSKLSLADTLASFTAARQAMGVTSRTLDFYRDTLPPFIAWCEAHGAPTIDAVTADHIRRYLVTLQERNLAAWTVHGAARAIKSLLRFAAADELIAVAPKFTMPKLPKGILPAFEPSDIQKLLGVAERDRDKAIILFLLDTGIRAAEFVALRGGAVDISTGAVVVQTGKGQKGRMVYLGAKSRRALLKHWQERKPSATAALWVSSTTGERLTESGLRQVLRRLGAAANVQHCHPHTFRRTFALWSLRAGMNIHVLARLMGHEDITVLKQYLALVEADLQSAHAAHGAVDRFLK